MDYKNPLAGMKPLPWTGVFGEATLMDYVFSGCDRPDLNFSEPVEVF